MGVFKEIAKADGSGTTTFYRLSSEEDTVETTSTDGTSTMIDYNSMLNKPSINDVALVGNKTLEDLGIQPAGDYLTAIPEEYITEEELEAKDYATETFVMEQINNTEHFHREIVDALPLTGKDNVLYLVPKKGSDKDIYNEYIWTGADYEFMGTTAVDLTDYYQKNEVDELLGTKVNKVSGKQLSTNDYTTAEKTKLASLENYDDSELRSKVDALHNYDDTAVKLDIQELKRDTSINEIDIASIENELGYKAEVIRLVKNGDWWLCQDAKGNNLTLEMAMNRLGLPKTILLLENLENDGKYYPVEYELQEKYIDIIYKDLDGITHHLNYGYNEYFTNAASGDYIHLEDSINYPYKKLEVDGVCEQKTTSIANGDEYDSPSPDYPQEIKTIENSFNITSCNKNFAYLKDGTYTKENDTAIINNNLITLNTSSSTGSYSYFSFGNGYTQTWAPAGDGIKNVNDLKLTGDGGNYIATIYTNKTISGSVSFRIYTSNNRELMTNIDRYMTSTINISLEDGEHIKDYGLWSGTASIFNDYQMRVQLEKGTTATPYEQHLETQIIANLPEGEFIGKINDTYKDTLKVEYNEEDGQYHLNLYKRVYKNNSYNGESYNYYISTTARKDGNIECGELQTGQVVYYDGDEAKIDLGVVDMPTTYDGVTNLYTDNDLLPTINIEYYTEILENAKDNIIGQDIYLQDEVDTLNDLPTEANKGDIRKVKDTGSWYIYDGTIWSAFDKASEIDLTNYLSKDNTIPYAPSTDYNPATKRYVDTKINDLFIPTKTSQLTNDSGFVLKSVNDLSNYYNKSNTYNKAEVNALVAGGGGGSNVSITVNGDTLVITTK